MPGVPTDLIEHKLHVRSDAKPVRQPLRRFKPAMETKKIPLDPEHPERHAVIGTGLDSK